MQQTAVHIDEFLLTDRLLAGDPGARELVYDQYAAPLYGMILHIVADTRKAEEVLTGVFMYVFSEVQAYRESGNTTLFGWMMRLAREMALKEISGDLSAGNGLLIRDNSLLQRFTAGLPERRQQIFRFSYYKGLSKEAVARMMGLQPEEVALELKETMIAFRKFLRD